MIKPGTKSRKMAEFVGILLGDGSISHGQNRLQVTLNKNELDYAHYVVGLIYEIFGKNSTIKFRKNENALDIHLFNKETVDFLIREVGMVESPKWNRAIVPRQFRNNRLSRYVLRGYFDTDGSVVITDNNGTVYPRLEMKVSPSPMKDHIVSMLKKMGFRFGVYTLEKNRVRIQMNGRQQLSKWVREIGTMNPNYSRKINIARGGFEPPTSGSLTQPEVMSHSRFR